MQNKNKFLLPKQLPHSKFTLILPFFIQILAHIGCGILIGNVKPKEEKSDNYSVSHLSETSPQNWNRLKDNLLTDVAYQSKQTAAIIAVSSSCRETQSTAPPQPTQVQLRKLSQPFFLGMTDISFIHERSLFVSGQPALETIAFGKATVDSSSPSTPLKEVGPVVLQSVVFQENKCTYKILSTSTPQAFPETLNEFSHFVESFQFKTS